jgi:hypothetical protein
MAADCVCGAAPGRGNGGAEGSGGDGDVVHYRKNWGGEQAGRHRCRAMAVLVEAIDAYISGEEINDEVCGGRRKGAVLCGVGWLHQEKLTASYEENWYK